jgi:septal ring factor EnvC (AmiA/AmiB activator)
MQKRVFDITRDSETRIYMGQKKILHIPVTKSLKVLFSLGIITFFFLSPVQAPQRSSFVSAQEQKEETEKKQTESEKKFSDLQTQRTELEQQLAEYEKQIEETQKTINEYKKKGSTLKNEISSLNAKIDKLNLQIKAVNVSLSKVNQDIIETQKQIGTTEDKIDTHKEALAGALRAIYQSDNQNIMTILLSHDTLSDFFGNLNNIALVQDNLRIALDEVTKLRQELLSQKEELTLQKEDIENLKSIQQAQKRNIELTQTEKNKILKDTKGKETEYQKILVKTKESAAQIRSRIFELLGGGQLTFEKAYDYAKLAEGATGVRSALILSILHRESLLGKNVGKCSYKTAMHPTRDIPYFLDLLKRLNIDPTSDFAKVSCANQHGAYGGAMGPAQFIPSTWKLYEDKIAKVTGNNPPSPWNNSDAFAATALYIKDLMDSKSCIEYGTQTPSQKSKLIERCAAAKYYAGARWYTYRMWYGEPVVQKAEEFEADIAVLNK